MKNKPLYSILFLLTLLFSACSGESNPSEEPEIASEEQMVFAPKTGEFYSTPLTGQNSAIIARPVTYDVVVKNHNPNDAWREECLSSLDLQALIKIVFDAAYAGQITAYNYRTEEPMTIDELRDFEKDSTHRRDRIGKVQFVEDWYFDAEKFQFGKRVKALMLAYERYNEAGELSANAYYPGIMVYLNEPVAAPVDSMETK